MSYQEPKQTVIKKYLVRNPVSNFNDAIYYCETDIHGIAKWSEHVELQRIYTVYKKWYIFWNSSSTSIGFAICAFIPCLIASCRSSSNALAVIAIIGMDASSLFASLRIALVALQQRVHRGNIQDARTQWYKDNANLRQDAGSSCVWWYGNHAQQIQQCAGGINSTVTEWNKCGHRYYPVAAFSVSVFGAVCGFQKLLHIIICIEYLAVKPVIGYLPVISVFLQCASWNVELFRELGIGIKLFAQERRM